jgi:two-component system OmpR family sensor kinase
MTAVALEPAGERAGPLERLSGRTPLRVKLVAMLLGITALAELVTGAAAAQALRGYLIDRVDDQLAATSRVMGTVVERGGFDSDLTQLPTEFLIRVSDPRGGLLAAGGRAGNQDAQPALELPAVDLDAVLAHGGLPFTAGADSGEWRVLLTTAAGGLRTIAVALPLTDVEATVHRLTVINLLVGICVLLLFAGLAYALVRSSLRPLVEVERTAEAIASGQLSSRVPERDPRTEVGRLTAALNGMLARIESAFSARAASEAEARASEDRMRRFVADASHELRTPLTSIRGFAELYRHGGVPPDELQRVMARVEAEATRMGLLVEDMLLLARLDQQRPLEFAAVDLIPLATDAVTDARALSPDHAVELVVRDGEPPVVVGDEQRLRQIVTNLVSNALRHTPAGTSVTVTVGVTGADAVLEVADTGPGMPPEDAERVFERFYRADPARARGQGGSGLGLSIVSALVRAHRGTVELTTSPGAGATFRVQLPRVPSA